MPQSLVPGSPHSLGKHQDSLAGQLYQRAPGATAALWLHTEVPQHSLFYFYRLELSENSLYCS